jgi:aspartyl-tRNA(Asn)/glutamyl-tRNA(Gln) amidotransferase subunit A
LVNNTTKTAANSPNDRISCGDSTATFYIPNNKRNLSHDTPQDDQHLPPLRGIRVGVPAAFSVDPCPPYIKTLWNKTAKILAEKGGAKIVIVPTTVVSPETIKASLSSYYVLACAEASSNLARYDGLRYGTNFEQLLSAPKYANPSSSNYETNERESGSEDDNYDDDLSVAVHRQYSATRALGFGPEVVRRILAGTAVLSSDRFHTHYEAAAKQRVTLRREFKSAFSKSPKTKATTYVTDEGAFSGVDVMIVPTSLALPRVLDSNIKNLGSAEEYEKSSKDMLSSDIMTVPLSLAGLPTMSVPVKLTLLDDNELKENVQPMNEVTRGLNVYHKIKSLGIQIFGPPMSEDLVMKVSSFIYENDKEQIYRNENSK